MLPYKGDIKLNIKPLGYHLLVEFEKIETEIQNGVLKGFKHASGEEAMRAQTGHDVGIVRAIGPTAHLGYAGCDGDSPEERAAKWGYGLGDTIIFKSYVGNPLPGKRDEGKHLRTPTSFITIVDKDAIAKIEEE